VHEQEASGVGDRAAGGRIVMRTELPGSLRDSSLVHEIRLRLVTDGQIVSQKDKCQWMDRAVERKGK